MKNKLLIVFILLAFSGFSQSVWTKGNAVWHYYYSGGILEGYVKVWESGDTILSGKQCVKLKAEGHGVALAGPQAGQYEFLFDYIGGAVYTSNDMVYYWDHDHFSVLYDFSAQVNDEWLLQTGGNPDYGCNDTSVSVVESVGTINIDGQDYPELTLGNSSDAAFYINGKANARFGSLGYLFPLPRNCDSSLLSAEHLHLICFEDDSLYYNPTGEACYFTLGMNEPGLKKVSVFPNPSSGKIELLSEVPLKQIRVMSVMGSVLKEVQTDLTLKEIDLSELPQGTYYLDIENRNGERVVKPVQLSGK